MKKRMLLITRIAGFMVFAIYLNNAITKNVLAQNAATKHAANYSTQSLSGIDTDKDGIPDNAEKVLRTDPLNPDTDGDQINDMDDVNPLHFDTQFVKTTGTDDFSIKEVLVENNYDSVAKKDASDHLELILKNNGDENISDMTVFYRITDLSTHQEQSYVTPLKGFILEKGSKKSVHIDTTQGTDHFRANPNGLFYSSMNEMRVNVIINAPGHLAQEESVKKDKGGAEVAD